MNRLVQEALLIGLAKRLSEKGSWTGETHLQKAAYLLSELCEIDFDFDFILYKHGPFSFELRDELGSMRAEGLLERLVPDQRYGPRFEVTKRGLELESQFTRTMARYRKSLDWISETLGARGVMDLERLATALWITRHNPEATVAARAAELSMVKRHIRPEDATDAVSEIDELLRGEYSLPTASE